jgi:hypothetical protein
LHLDTTPAHTVRKFFSLLILFAFDKSVPALLGCQQSSAGSKILPGSSPNTFVSQLAS